MAYLRVKSVDNANHLTALSSETSIEPWSTEGFDCIDGALYFGGGGGGDALTRAPGSASIGPNLRPARRYSSSRFFENSLLNGVSVGTQGQDICRLPGSIANGNAGAVRLRAISGRAAALDAARLLVVDHVANVSAYVLGGAIVTGTRHGPSRITAGDGTDLTTVLDGSGTYPVTTSDDLRVDLGTGAGLAPVVVRAGGTGPLQIQVPDGQGGWRIASQIRPRIDPDELVFPTPGSDSIRITTRGWASLSYVGSLTVAADPPTVHEAVLISCQSSRLGDVKSAVASVDSASATLVGPDTLALTYLLPEAADGAREYFLAVNATRLDPETLPPAQLKAVGEELPVRFALEQNRPNPFRASTAIRFALPVASQVRLEIFDLQGRRVALLANGSFVAGYQTLKWDHRDGRGNQARPGIYLYRLQAGTFRSEKKMVLLSN